MIAGAPAKGQPLVAVIDDDVFVTEAWIMMLAPDVAVRTFSGARAFWAALAKEPELRQNLTVVVTDQYFAAGETETGLEVAAELRRQRPALPVLLASDGLFSAAELQAVHRRIDKIPLIWRDLKALI